MAYLDRLFHQIRLVIDQVPAGLVLHDINQGTSILEPQRLKEASRQQITAQHDALLVREL